MKTVREFLIEVCEKNGWSTDEDGLREALANAGTVLHKKDAGAHRWYIKQIAVTDIAGRFIQYTDYLITGDKGMDDMGLEYDVDGAIFVQRKERQVTEVYYEPVDSKAVNT